MSFRLHNLKLMTRLSLTGIVGLLAMAVIIWESVGSLDELLYEDREVKTRHLVELAYGVVESFHADAKAGKISEDEARQAAIRTLKSLRYEKTEYFWINDLGKPYPTMVMHPTVPALDGKVLDEARFDKAIAARPGDSADAVALANKNLFVAFNEVVDRAGHGFVTYLWPKPQASGGVTDELFTKISYVKKFEPWGWVIGSGIYVDDVNALFWKHASHSLILALIGTGLMLLVAFLIRRSILAEFGGEPKEAMGFAQRIADGDLTGEIRLRADDQSSLLFRLSHMQDSLRQMIEAMVKNAHEVQSSIERLSSESNQITLATQLQTSVVGSTRAGVQELSTSVDVVNTLAGDTEASSQEVARRSQQGATLAEEVRKLAERTTVSTVEIAQILQAIQGETSRAVKGMNEAAPVIASGVEKATTAASTLREIEQRAIDSLGKMKTLAEATTGQTRRIAEIVQRMDEVTDSTSRTEDAIQQSQETSSELEHAANELFQMAKRFNVGADLLKTDDASPGADRKVRPLMEWSPALAVGFSEIDRQHQRLIEIANELNGAMHAGGGAKVAGAILNELVDYTVNHFAYEEGLMKKYDYRDSDAHVVAHKKLIDDVSHFKRQFDAGNATISVELLGFIRNWLLDHILKVDKALARDLNARGLK